MDECDCCLAEWKAMRIGGHADGSFSVLDEESTIHRIKEINWKLTVERVIRFEGLLLFHFQTITHNVTQQRNRRSSNHRHAVRMGTHDRADKHRDMPFVGRQRLRPAWIGSCWRSTSEDATTHCTASEGFLLTLDCVVCLFV